MVAPSAMPVVGTPPQPAPSLPPTASPLTQPIQVRLGPLGQDALLIDAIESKLCRKSRPLPPDVDSSSRNNHRVGVTRDGNAALGGHSADSGATNCSGRCGRSSIGRSAHFCARYELAGGDQQGTPLTSPIELVDKFGICFGSVLSLHANSCQLTGIGFPFQSRICCLSLCHSNAL